MEPNINIKAIAFFGKESKIKGTVTFTEDIYNDLVLIKIDLKGLKKKAKQGFHVHEAGDLTLGCESACSHFNPYNKTHGCPEMKNRHVGDLGNIESDSKGKAKYMIYDECIKLRGKSNIIGRCLVIHEDEDDCGKGDNELSLITGNSGKRVSCAIIGYSKDSCFI